MRCRTKSLRLMPFSLSFLPCRKIGGQAGRVSYILWHFLCEFMKRLTSPRDGRTMGLEFKLVLVHGGAASIGSHDTRTAGCWARAVEVGGTG